ncbi:hypothetical protein COLO4_08932 [Corchorus olitorius]|uniref:Uncharacterized protein n=1 Tax=Corchorus olitorius TaxID=93759 RepID=A0A1R3KE02_9ROSI|nr:hypothetical protein COLO4_08932 [Corchorus olitorius]
MSSLKRTCPEVSLLSLVEREPALDAWKFAPRRLEICPEMLKVYPETLKTLKVYSETLGCLTLRCFDVYPETLKVYSETLGCLTLRCFDVYLETLKVCLRHLNVCPETLKKDRLRSL